MREGIDEYRASGRSWAFRMSLFGILHWGLGVAAKALSTAVATGTPFAISSAAYSYEKYLAVVATGTITFLGAGDNFARYRRAYRRLRLSIARYDHDAKTTYDDVERAYLDGAAMLSQAPDVDASAAAKLESDHTHP